MPGPNNPLIPDPDEEKDLPLQPMDTTGSDFYEKQQEERRDERRSALEAERKEKRKKYIAGLNPAQQESLFKRRPELSPGGEKAGEAPGADTPPPQGQTAPAPEAEDTDEFADLVLNLYPIETSASFLSEDDQAGRRAASDADANRNREEPRERRGAGREALPQERQESWTAVGPEGAGSTTGGPSAGGPVDSGGSQQDVQILEELRLIRHFLQAIDSNIESIESNGVTVVL